MIGRTLSPNRLRKLAGADARNVVRDPVLLSVMVMSALPSIALFAQGSALDDWAFRVFGFEGAARIALPFVLTLPAFLIGWVTGFLFLEDRDEGTLLALDITPLGKSGYAAYRIGYAALITFVLTLLAAQSLLPDKALAFTLLIAALIAVEAAASALILPAIACNKVEGLALTKLTNLLALSPYLALFSGPWRYMFAPLPGFWIGELLGFGGPQKMALPLAAMLALGIHLGVLWLLLQLFRRRAG